MIQKFDIYVTPGKERRTVHMYLPNDYYESEERYPVVYMFDGMNLFNDCDATYGKSWGIGNFLDWWDKKVIVVGVECSHHGWDRITEYCPYRIKASHLGVVKGRGEATMDWYVKRLKKYIDKNFRTWPQREATAIGGSSMGGMMALYAIIKYNDVFSKAAVVSPAFFDSMPAFRREVKRAKIDEDTRVFFSWGTEEDWRGFLTKHVLEMEDLLQKKANCSTWLYHQQGGQHCEAHWEMQVPTWMEFMWK